MLEGKNFLDCTLVDLLRWRALHQSEQYAYKFLADGERETTYLTYGELDRLARAIATQLQSCGTIGERALLLYPPGLEFIAGFFGCLYAGYVAIPAYPPRPNRSISRIEAIIADAQPTIALTTTAIFSELQQWFVEHPQLQTLSWLQTNQVAMETELSWQQPVANGNTLAYLQYTSGSTSTPKGVMVSHKNVLHNSEYIRQAFELTSDSVSMSWLPHFHDMGLLDGIIQPLYTGFLGYLMPPVAFLQKPWRWLMGISRYRVTHAGAPNFAYELCINKISAEQKENLDLSSWDSAYNGAEPVRLATLERFAAAFDTCGFRPNFFYPCYGLAEATLMVSGGVVGEQAVSCVVEAKALEENRVVETSPTDKNAKHLVSCGRSRLDTKIMIVEPESRTRCANAEIGEIWVSGASVAQGYWQKPEQTQQTFQAYLADTQEGPFLRTGDLGFLRDGELFVTGRLKDLLIIRGRNHYPQDIELTVEQSHQALRSGCGAVVEVLVEGEERLVVIQEIERNYLRKLNLEELARAIRQSVAQKHELQIFSIVLLKTGSLPKTSSGKIQRHACRTGFLSGTLDAVATSVLQPGDEEETAAELSREDLLAMTAADFQQQLLNHLQQQVARLLKIAPSQLDSQQPISQLGLDSLMAVECKHYLETSLGVTVAIADLLQDFSLAQLSAKIWEQMQNSPLRPSTAFVPLSAPAFEYPLSPGQMALWFEQQISSKSSAYNTFFAARILSDLDVPTLKKILQILCERHSAIRVTFHMVNGQPVQRVQPNLQVVFTEIDATNWSQDELNEQLAKSAYHPFNLEQELPIRVSLFRRGVAEDILLLSAHHIAIDFWSLEVLLTEIGILYPQIQTGLPKLPKLNWQYADYVNWQADMLAGNQGERLGNYWQKQLTGKLPVLNLPTDKPRSPTQTYHGAVENFYLQPDVVERLKILSQTEGVTLYVLLLAAFQILLYRYTAQEDILVGSPTAGRSKAELSDMVGYFVNPVVFRVNLSENPKFTDFLLQVRQVVLAALEHQDYPLSLLVQKLQPQRDLSYSPLFQVMFVLEKSQRIDDLAAFWWGKNGCRIDVGGLLLESVAIEQQVALFDLTLTMLETDGELVGSWQYNRNLFDSSTIARMAENFQNLLASIVANPEYNIQQLPLSSPAAEHQLLVWWNNTYREYPQTQCIHQLFETQVEKTPNAIALVFDKQQLTYQELNCRANQLAHYLQSLGVGRETLVGICVERSIEMLLGLLGILKAGGAYVPLDPTYPQERLAFILQDTQALVLLTQEHLLELLPTHNAHIICLDVEWQAIAQESTENPVSQVTLDNLIYTIYTSGSTGKPKGIAMSHLCLYNLILWQLQNSTANSKSKTLQFTSISFDVSCQEIFSTWCAGGTLVMVSEQLRREAVSLWRLVSKQGIQRLFLPFVALQQLAEIADSEKIFPTSLREVITAGEQLQITPQIRHLFKQLKGCILHNHYGPSESHVVTAFTLDNSPETWPVLPTIGRPIANTQIYILDTHLQVVPIGVPGELYIGGVALARGYLNFPELTKEKFIPNPFDNSKLSRLYKTGDLARYLPDGNIEFLGRIDNQVKIRGFRIELGEIESAIALHPSVQQTVVTARVDDSGDKRLIAYIIPHPEQTPTTDQLRLFLKQKLPEYMVPSAFVFLDTLPLTPNGKIDRRALPAPDSARPNLEETFVAPRTDIEQQIADIWTSLLKLEKVGIHDNFFTLGGHSLLATQIISRLRQAFGIELPLRTLFAAPTVAELANRIETLFWATQNTQDDTIGNYAEGEL